MHARQENGVWLPPELAPFNVGINSFIEQRRDEASVYVVVRGLVVEIQALEHGRVLGFGEVGGLFRVR